MKRILSLVCVIGMFAFIAPQAGAITVTKVMSNNASVDQQTTGDFIVYGYKLYEQAVKNNLAAHPKRRQSKTRMYEQPIQNNVIARRRIGRGPGSGY